VTNTTTVTPCPLAPVPEFLAGLGLLMVATVLALGGIKKAKNRKPGR